MSKLRGSGKSIPSEGNLRWEYFLRKGFVPSLERGDYVLVEYLGRNRVAIVCGKIPGGCYWANLCSHVGGQSRVVVSKYSLVAVSNGQV